jgi:hypothetical protein
MAELTIDIDLTGPLTKAGFSQALIDVVKERARQMKEEGWDA